MRTSTIPEKWGEWRNPVKYTTLEELGIDLDKLKFKPMPAPTKISDTSAPSRPQDRRPDHSRRPKRVWRSSLGCPRKQSRS